MMSGKFLGRISAAHLSLFFMTLIVITFFILSAVAGAEEITYTGDGNKLQPGPAWFDEEMTDCLFPGTTAAPLSSGNKVTMNYNPSSAGVKNPVSALGGLGESENAANNNFVLLNGRVDSGVVGGWSYNNSAADNRVSISGGSVGAYVYGGCSENGNVVSNIITFSKEAVAEGVCGGWSYDGDVTDNSVAISGGAVIWNVFGGVSTNGSIAGNIVTINGGSMSASVYGGQGNSIVADNAVIISGGFVEDGVYGGCSYKNNVTGNSVVISDGSVKAGVCGGYSNTGNATSNAVTILGGFIDGYVYGGWSRDGGVSENKIIISGGFVEDGVYGGLSHESNVTNNSVTISGRPNLTKAHLYGGYSYSSPGDPFTGSADITMSVSVSHPIIDVFTGNTLNLKSSDISVASVGNFEYYSFDLPRDLAAGAVMLSVADKEVFLTQRTVEISLQGSIKLKDGDKIALIYSAAGISGAPKNKSCKVKHDGVLYEFSIYTDKNNLWAKVTKISVAAK